MELHRYRFESRWHLAASTAAVYRVLEDVGSYPTWWPQVTLGRRLGRASCEMAVRSVLPYHLRFVLDQARRDPENRVLEATMSGDLDGYSRWTVLDAPNGTVAVFEEDVVARKALLRRLAPMGRPAFRANHAWMMREGRRGLVGHLGEAADHAGRWPLAAAGTWRPYAR